VGKQAEAAGRVGEQVVRFIRGFKSVQAQTMHRARHGVDPSGYPVLFQLVESAKRTTELAACLQADISTVSRQVTTLVDAGLVERTIDPDDRRATILQLTAAGRDVFTAMKADRDRVLTSVLSDWTEPDVAELVRLLTRFNDDFDEARPAIIAELTKEN
jgi:DNA-binding MarR family transcriptional regulator